MVFGQFLQLLLIPKQHKCQTFDYTSMSLTLSELRPIIQPSRVENIVQDDQFNLLMQLKTNESVSNKNEIYLLLNWHPNTARIGIGKAPAQRSGIDTSFATLLRTNLKNKLLTSVDMHPSERLVSLEFSSKIKVDETDSSLRLVLEVAGPRSNVVLVAADQNILGCGYQVSSETTVRPLQIGGIYNPPPSTSASMARFTVSDMPFRFNELKSLPYVDSNTLICKYLNNNIRGMSPRIAEAIVTSAGVSCQDIIANISDETLNIIQERLIDWNHLIVSSTFRSSDLVNPTVTSSGYDLITFDSLRQTVDSHKSPLAINEALFQYYTSYQHLQEFTSRRHSCERRVEQLLRKGEKLRHLFEAQLAEAEGGKADSLTYSADLVTAFMYAWRPQQLQLECIDFITGETVTVNIAPGSTPSQYADKLYAKARKLRRSIKSLIPLVKETNGQLDYLMEVKAAIDTFQMFYSVDDLVALREIEEELDYLSGKVFLKGIEKAQNEETDEDSKHLEKKTPNKIKRSHLQKKKGKATHDAVKVKVKSTAVISKKGGSKVSVSDKKLGMKGLLVLRPRCEVADERLPPIVVGRNSKQNERVTFEIGREHHLWFHVQGFPGSHCLLQLEPGEVPSKEGMQAAADVAAYFSQAKGSTSVAIGYCSPKHIRRISGGSPGTVSILRQEGVLYGIPERGKALAMKYGPRETSPI